jgi:nicotinate-nucleotide adenylyltransferase
MRIGVFGGSFDPVHFGHLILAEQCREQAALDEVWFIPAARPPHKLTAPVSPFEHRVAMLRLALEGQSGFRVDTLEGNRPGPSYTADTLDELNKLHPGNDWYYLLGSDSVPDLPTWHEPQRVIARAGLVVIERHGSIMPESAEVAKSLRIAPDDFRMQVIDAPLIDLASRDIRQRSAVGRSIRFMVPQLVEFYIQKQHLYSSSKQQ